MVLKLIKEASMYGWHVVTSADVSAKVTKMVFVRSAKFMLIFFTSIFAKIGYHLLDIHISRHFPTITF